MKRFWGSPFRLFVIFSVGIIIPSGVLTYLGFRSFQYERTLLQNQAQERYKSTATSIQRKGSDIITGLLDAVKKIGAQKEFQALSVPEMTTILLSLTKIDNIAIQESFVFNAQHDLIVPYLSSSEKKASSVGTQLDWGPYQSELRRLEQLEFGNKDLDGAISGYQVLLKNNLRPQLKAALMKNIGGAYRKAGKIQEAAFIYRNLINQSQFVPDPIGYDTGIVAHQLLIDLYQSDNQTKNATKAQIALYEGLILSKWSVPNEQKKKLLDQLDKSTAGPWTQVKKLRQTLQTYQKKARRFTSSTWPRVLQALKARQWLNSGGLVEQKNEMAVVAPIFNTTANQLQGHLVVLVNKKPLYDELTQAIKTLGDPVGLLLGMNSPDWKPSLDITFDEVDPPALFSLNEPTNKKEQALLEKRMRIFYGMVSLSFLVVLVGLVLMFRAIRQEMATAALRSEFVANVSHELKTPLSSISYIGEKLMAGRYKSKEEAMEFYGMLNEEAGRLKNLIGEVLDFSKIEQGRKIYKKVKMNLAETLHRAVESVKPRLKETDFKIHVETKAAYAWVQGEDASLFQAIVNLLDNAIKYSGEAKKINVTLQINKKNAEVVVQDFGIGIVASECEKIFKKFYRTERALARQSEGGFGLGLAIVKHIMESHHGRVLVQSTVGKGSTFTLRIPLIKNGTHTRH